MSVVEPTMGEALAAFVGQDNFLVKLLVVVVVTAWVGNRSYDLLFGRR